MIRSVANRYYRMSRTLACRTWKGFRRIPKDSKGRGEATMGLYCLRMTRKLEVVTNELANERYTPALVTARLFFFRRLQRLLTVHSRPRGPVHHVFLDAGWGEREGRGKGDEARRGNSRSRFTRSCTFRYGERTKVSDSRIPRRASASFEIEERWRR